MSSNRRIKSSRANGAKSHGPSTPEGKKRSSLNAMRHGLLAKCVLLQNESAENFQLLMQMHIDRFQPADDVELVMVEEMCAACWRMRRGWAIETRMIDTATNNQPPANQFNRMVDAVAGLATTPALSLIHRYESRLQLIYQRAIRTFMLLRTIDVPDQDLPDQDLPKEPNPTTEHSESGTPDAPQEAQKPPQAADSEASTSAYFSSYGVPLKPPAAHSAPPPRVKEFGAAG